MRRSAACSTWGEVRDPRGAVLVLSSEASVQPRFARQGSTAASALPLADERPARAERARRPRAAARAERPTAEPVPEAAQAAGLRQ